MRNYVIINGKKSDYVRGLMIQELPPITLPPVRTEIIEIEGRDGDIVEKLGYQAYDKEFSIGLYGDYDVNQIISYFAQSGSIIFSNEPDKYYQFEMINQIDLERLIRYKTATITLHVQPFKYSAINEYYNFIGGIIPYNMFTKSENGISLLSYGSVRLDGTADANTTFSIPIDTQIPSGDKTVHVKIEGTGTISVGLNDGESYFGGNLVSVTSGNTIINGSLETLTRYTELIITVEDGEMLSLNMSIMLGEISIWNDGNHSSTPKYTIQGTGLIALSINDKNPFFINLTNNSPIITLDVENLEAYYGGINMNRIVSGDYRNLILDVGENLLNIDGDVQQIVIEKFERWL